MYAPYVPTTAENTEHDIPTFAGSFILATPSYVVSAISTISTSDKI